MYENFLQCFQRIKWDILAKINPNYYINSKLSEQDEDKYKGSGYNDVKKFILGDELLNSLINFKETTILEIGCGNGRLTEFLAGIFRKVYGVDISPTMVDLAKSRLFELDNVDFLVGDGLHFMLPDSAVDLVFSYIVFQHFPSLDMVLKNMKEVKRVLKDGGLAKIQFRGKPAFGGVFRIFKWYYGVFVTSEKILDIARELNLKILSITGEDSKEMWVIFRK